MMFGFDEKFYYEYDIKTGTLAAIMKKYTLTDEEKSVVEEAMKIFRKKGWERKILCAELITKKQILEKEFGLIEKLKGKEANGQ